MNISKPGITKGQHWHHSKWEFFIVVSGEALIQQRRIGDGEVLEFKVSADDMQAVHMLPGYTHNIINLSDSRDLVTLMWANECLIRGSRIPSLRWCDQWMFPFRITARSSF